MLLNILKKNNNNKVIHVQQTIVCFPIASVQFVIV